MTFIIYRMHFLRFEVDFSVRRRFLVDFRRFRTFCTRLKIDPFGWAPSSVGCRFAAAILLHAHRDRFGAHFGDLSGGIFGRSFVNFVHFSSILVYRWPQIAYETSLKMSRHSPLRSSSMSLSEPSVVLAKAQRSLNPLVGVAVPILS
jgi:hypothetical protein